MRLRIAADGSILFSFELNIPGGGRPSTDRSEPASGPVTGQPEGVKESQSGEISRSVRTNWKVSGLGWGSHEVECCCSAEGSSLSGEENLTTAYERSPPPMKISRICLPCRLLTA